MCIKLVIKTNLYYDARSEKHKKTIKIGSDLYFQQTSLLLRGFK
jgi:hypothetical protein